LPLPDHGFIKSTPCCADTAHHPNQAVVPGGLSPRGWHEVDHLADAGLAEEPGDEDRRVGERDGHPDEVMRPPSGRSTVGTSARLVTADKENTP
jgi:hypothetical protein